MREAWARHADWKVLSPEARGNAWDGREQLGKECSTSHCVGVAKGSWLERKIRGEKEVSHSLIVLNSVNSPSTVKINGQFGTYEVFPNKRPCSAEATEKASALG